MEVPVYLREEIRFIDSFTTPAAQSRANVSRRQVSISFTWYISFSGGSAEEAEDFILAVKRRAYSEGKHKDDAWIADFVSVCLEKKALRWYESLDRETQNDWQLLKRAILDEYKEAPVSPSIVPTPASALESPDQGLTPAAAPDQLSRFKESRTPSTIYERFARAPRESAPERYSKAIDPLEKTSPSRIGRIRVKCDLKSLQGYISDRVNASSWCTVSQNPSTAATFEFDVSTGTIKFQASPGAHCATVFALTSAVQGTTDDYLGARLYDSDWDSLKPSD
ncbi:hypothetical protein FRC00_008321, partial [Tulasnella sp. 408]